MAKSKRVTLTKTEAASAYGQRLIHQILAISDDGNLTIEEVRALHAVLMDGPMEIEAVPFLRAKTTVVLHDGELDHLEMYQLRCAMERVVPKDVRSDLTILLSRIGLPTMEEEEEDGGYRVKRSWHDDPVTTRQLEFIRDLGGVATERMTKGAASLLIDQLLERRPPSPRQRMVLRFFDRVDLMEKTKEEISIWLDALYRQHEEYEQAWHLFKAAIGDDGSMCDPSIVPIGAYRQYLRSPRAPTAEESRPTRAHHWRLILLAAGAALLLGALWHWAAGIAK
jgi:hypothetical protein